MTMHGLALSAIDKLIADAEQDLGTAQIALSVSTENVNTAVAALAVATGTAERRAKGVEFHQHLLAELRTSRGVLDAQEPA